MDQDPAATRDTAPLPGTAPHAQDPRAQEQGERTLRAGGPLPRVQGRSRVHHEQDAGSVRTTRRPRWTPPAWLPVLAVLALLVAVFGLPSLPNPFASKEVDRSPAPLLQALENLSRYQGATGNFQVVVDVERDVANVPSVLAGERTLFLAQGSVDGFVEFGGLGEGAIETSDDRRSVTVTLPPATVSEPHVDPAQSRVISRDRGVLDRLGGVLSDNPTSERELYLMAQQRMLDAAASSDLRSRTEENTRSMLVGMLTGLGYTDVRVEFTPDARP